jgi:hypothetical protein
MEDEYGENLQLRGLKKYYLKSGDALRYSWDMPAVKDKQLILSVHGRERRINIQEIGDQIPFRHRVSNIDSMLKSIASRHSPLDNLILDSRWRLGYYVH